MNTQLDRSFFGLLIGPIVGFLVMKGFVDPSNATSLTQSLDQVIGGAIALVSIIGFFVHHTAVSTAKLQNKQSMDQTPAGTPASAETPPVTAGSGGDSPAAQAAPPVTS